MSSLYLCHKVLSKFGDPILLSSSADRFHRLFRDNTHHSVRCLLSINVREDLKRSVSQGKVGLSERLSTLPEIPLLLFIRLMEVNDFSFA